MALTSTTTLDDQNQTGTISFYQSATLVDQITFSSNQVTFATISSFNLSKSDVLLYYKLLVSFFVQMQTNFGINSSADGIFPLCNFQLQETSVGVTHIYYNQSSQGNTVYASNYVPVAVSASYSARSAVTISVQEFILAIYLKGQWTNQVSLN